MFLFRPCTDIGEINKEFIKQITQIINNIIIQELLMIINTGITAFLFIDRK